MYETVRIVSKLKPKYVLWENVKNLLSKKHKHNFDNYIETMSIIGYNSYYKVLDAKDYGVPQHRERVYTVSIRKDIDNWDFVFPEPMELKLRLKDVLEDAVEEKYYLSEKMVNFFYKNEQIQKEKGNGFRFGVSDGNVVAKSVTTRAGSRMDDNFIKCVQVAQVYGTAREPNPQAGRIYDSGGLSPTMDTCNGGNRMPKVLIDNYRIRKLTPKECWRLMGFDDEDFEKAASVPTSNTQLYKQAGNSIVVNVLENILTNLFNTGRKKTRREFRLW